VLRSPERMMILDDLCRRRRVLNVAAPEALGELSKVISPTREGERHQAMEAEVASLPVRMASPSMLDRLAWVAVMVRKAPLAWLVAGAWEDPLSARAAGYQRTRMRARACLRQIEYPDGRTPG
jgi:hypothetical protein